MISCILICFLNVKRTCLYVSFRIMCGELNVSVPLYSATACYTVHNNEMCVLPGGLQGGAGGGPGLLMVLQFVDDSVTERGHIVRGGWRSKSNENRYIDFLYFT